MGPCWLKESEASGRKEVRWPDFRDFFGQLELEPQVLPRNWMLRWFLTVCFKCFDDVFLLVVYIRYMFEHVKDVTRLFLVLMVL